MKNVVSKVSALLLACCMLFSLVVRNNGATTVTDNKTGGILSVSGDLVGDVLDIQEDTSKDDTTDNNVGNPDVETETDTSAEDQTQNTVVDNDGGSSVLNGSVDNVSDVQDETDIDNNVNDDDVETKQDIPVKDKTETDVDNNVNDTVVETEQDTPVKDQTQNAVVDTENTIVKPDSTSDTNDVQENVVHVGTQTEKEPDTDNEDISTGNTLVSSPKGDYNEGVVLVKVKDTLDTSSFGDLEYTAVEALFDGSSWYVVTLADATATEAAVAYLSNVDAFEKVDYDYVMGVTADVSSVNVSGNPHYGKHKHHHVHKIPEGWQHIKDNGKQPGGSNDVVVAVIDTGVDYTHLDLCNNIWVNTAEIAGNGKDDDGNGYIDDVYGWDCVGNDKDPMDDNGHGTHVAGIIAAENNDLGGVGIAYNCKIMVLKAGNSSGYFNNSDIAEAIQYAYMNGASVINMSFGGSNISVAVEEALENAYNSCVLVAAAGNDGACNNLSCQTCDIKKVSYPAALPYVIGVMSTNADGSAVSGFSNYDHNPYNSIEYEVYAVGEGIPSTWPGNKYADLNGTSMAAPTVSGIAALLRSAYPDRETYSTKFIQSQIVNTGSQNPYNALLKTTDDAHSVANVYEALTQLPKPEVNLYDYSIDDSTAVNAANNGNGVIDAGETIRLYVSLHNRGGVAENVSVSIDTERSEGLTDPYFTFVNDTIALSDVGTYSVRESGDKYFEIVVSADCPNDYLVDFNIRYTYTNGMDENDDTVYEDDGNQKAQFNVSRGYHLPSSITEDTVYTADRLYIVGEDVVIPAGVTVTFEEGCEIQFYDDREYYNSPVVTVYGTLLFEGTKENVIKIAPNERNKTFICKILSAGSESNIELKYVKSTNLSTTISNGYIINSYLESNSESNGGIYAYNGGTPGMGFCSLSAESITRNYINLHYGSLVSDVIKSNFIILDGWRSTINVCSEMSNNIICNCKTKNVRDIERRISVGKNGAYSTVKVYNNIFSSLDLSSTPTIKKLSASSATVTYSNNLFSPNYQQHASEIFENYYDASGNPIVDVYGSLADMTAIWPYVVSVEMFDKDGNAITTVGREEITVRVTFNRPMDVIKDTYLTFGTIEPYGDYRIDGEYISDTVWEGTYTLKAQIENGQNFLKVNNACAAEDPTKTVFGEYHLHEFTIDTTAAMAMNLQAVAKEEGVELTFAQDDYDTLLGYNIYRSTEKDGNYVKLNPAILLPDENVFLDDNAEPGKTYLYTYTVVLSDFTESNPAGKVMATAMDTMSPSLYHTPVNQGYENNNLVISATASDNVAISSVTLYYRAVGATEWSSLTMSKQNDKYSATVFGSEVTLAGLEYYIVATDGRNAVMKGSAEVPYTVVVKSADSLLGLGDVDGNGNVTIKDALMLMQCINGDLILSDDQFKRADLNGDGVLSSAEALRILQYINGKVTTLEM